jgi:membrane protein YdbS with pleckstrin-like domain
MREQPSWRIPVGILALLAGLIVYGVVIARFAPDLIGGWPIWAQTIIYVVLGVIWLLPLKRFLIWMETGRWSAPD